MQRDTLPARYRLALRINIRKNKNQYFAMKTVPLLLFFGMGLIWAALRFLWPEKAGSLLGMGIYGLLLLCFLTSLSFFVNIFLCRIARHMLTDSKEQRYLGRRPFFLMKLTPPLAVELALLGLVLFGTGTFFSVAYCAFTLHTLFCWEDFHIAAKLFTFPDATLIEQADGAVTFYVQADEGMLPDREEAPVEEE